ncbi:hypothetical protein QCA50_011130 [Cerrena zonata]|uniref:Peptidase M12A domain-containing protein n=1 Tax=Cerrena zonata TaxID=2478898 RepID=A0AAW0G286_9APHY
MASKGENAQKPVTDDTPGGAEVDVAWYEKACADLHPLDEAAEEVEESDDSTFRANAVMVKQTLLWPQGTVLTYRYLDGNDVQKKKVDDTIKEWERYMNLKFKRDDNAKESKIRIGFNKRKGSWSYVGAQNEKIAQNQPTMNLGWVNPSTPSMDAHEKGTILHEFGHALGLMHEHQSPARGGTITLEENAVYRFYMASQGWSAAQVKAQIIDVYNKKDVSNYSNLDTKSIMMYFMPAAMNKQHKEIKPNTKLTDTDKAFMLLNYFRQKPHAEDSQWTLSHALTIAGVSEDEQQVFLDSQDSPEAIREMFTTWSVQQHAGTQPLNAPSVPRNTKGGHGGHTAQSDGFLDDLIQSTKELLPPSGGRPYVVVVTQEGDGKSSQSSNNIGKQVMKSGKKLLDAKGGRPYVVVVTQEGK